jgi:hypothetical protein
VILQLQIRYPKTLPIVSAQRCARLIILNYLVVLSFFAAPLLPAQKISREIIESTSNYIVVKLNFSNSYRLEDTVIDGRTFQKIAPDFLSIRKAGEPSLPQYFFTVGVPQNASPNFEVLSTKQSVLHNKLIIPFPDIRDTSNVITSKSFNKLIYSRNEFFPSQTIEMEPVSTMRYAEILTIGVSPYQYNPVTKDLKFSSEITLKIIYAGESTKSQILNGSSVNDKTTDKFLRTNVLNYPIAKNWVAALKNKKTQSDNYWYTPDKNFYKIFLKTKGIYRITYEDLIQAGVTLPSGLSSSALEVFVQGESIPLEVFDSGDGVFGPGDYFQFFGTPAPPSPYAKQNIYNTENVFWFSYHGNESTAKRYTELALPSDITDTVITYRPRTDFYERDSIFEHLGESNTTECDYWFWGITTANAGKTIYSFTTTVNNFYKLPALNSEITYHLNLQGMTNTYCHFDHHALVYLNGKQIGGFSWDGQTDSTFTGSFNPSRDTITLAATGNVFQVTADGNVCSDYKVDDIRINWFEFTYNSMLDASGNSLSFSSEASSKNKNAYNIMHWNDSNISIYAPVSGQKFTATFMSDTGKTVTFSDTITAHKDYFAISNSSFLKVDSIKAKSPSYLRRISNGADYIIIKHDKFSSIAQRLKTLREKSFPDSLTTGPRIFIADVQDIYDEFSYGILDPYALKYFVQYAFQMWTAPAAQYVTLIGDMSHDYRHLLKSSRINYIPSIPYHSFDFGYSTSDNDIAAVSGDDIIPDLAIGRISIEEVSEGTTILNKLENYPADNSKLWKQTVALFSSGLSSSDASIMGFNSANMYLDNVFLKPASMRSKKVFRYPTNSDESQHQGGVVEMRDAINSGAVLLNYYGHGGGSQWDLTFYSDDIYMLQNDNRLPVILNPTCYTAYFDNQDIFGEQFLKVPNKGCIGFFGCAGMTHWEAGRIINENIFQDIFVNKNHISGKAFQNAKALSPTSGYYADQISLLTYLGDPALQLAIPEQADYAVGEADITATSSTLLTNQTGTIKLNIHNYGAFSSDSINIKLEFLGSDTSGIIGMQKIAGFSLDDSLVFTWTPVKGGDYTLKVEINYDRSVTESDYTNNSASSVVTVFNLSEPNSVEPLNGQYQSSNSVQFTFADITTTQAAPLTYYIEIDTTLNFTQPLIKSAGLTGNKGVLTWNSPGLSKGRYFWHSRIFDGTNYGAWSAAKSFSVGDSTFAGVQFQSGQLKLFSLQNVIYDASKKTFLLNKDALPPKPDAKRLIADIRLNDSSTFSQSNMSLCATDGKYFYLAEQASNAALINHDTTGRTSIYKVGTGLQGTTAGTSYGTVSGFNKAIYGQYCLSKQGLLYAPSSQPFKIMRINPSSGSVDTLTIANGLLERTTGITQNGNFLLASDSNYVYNLAYKDSSGNPSYTLQIFAPDSSWKLTKTLSFSGVKALNNITGFFVCGNYFYTYGEENNGIMQRVNFANASDTLTWQILPSNSAANGQWYYGWIFDMTNDFVYATQHRPGIELSPAISKFQGKYYDPTGIIASPQIGPATAWKNITFVESKSGNAGTFKNIVIGFNKSTKSWDTLRVTSSALCDMSNIATSSYPYVKTISIMSDSTFDISSSLGLQSISFGYNQAPELLTSGDFISLSADTVIQTTNIDILTTIRNISHGNADSVIVTSRIDGVDIPSAIKVVSIPADSSVNVKISLPTSGLTAQAFHTIKITASVPNDDVYSFNNTGLKNFYIQKDTIKPVLDVTFDGKHIINGDIVSPATTVMITLSDNIPTKIDSGNFIIVFDNKILTYADNDISFTYSTGSKSSTSIIWKANFTGGNHTLKIQAKDANGNFSGTDSTFQTFDFNVFTENDVALIYPYPDPFSENTYFTFQLRGKDKPENVAIKIYTIAGRLIRTISADGSNFDLNFNKLYWDGRDNDGDKIANGVYLYKFIVRFKNKTVSSVNKLAKVSY